MSKQSTEQRLIDQHPHHLWCLTHDENVGDELVSHFANPEFLALAAGGSLELQIERTTHPTGQHSQHDAAPRIYLAKRGQDGVRLSLAEAEALRAGLGDATRLARSPEIPAGDERLDRPDRCPSWCMGANDDPDWHAGSWHVGRSQGPHGWFVRRAMLHVPGANPPRMPLVKREEQSIELSYSDDTPYDIDAPTARSIAAALIRLADEVESG